MPPPQGRAGLPAEIRTGAARRLRVRRSGTTSSNRGVSGGAGRRGVVAAERGREERAGCDSTPLLPTFSEAVGEREVQHGASGLNEQDAAVEAQSELVGGQSRAGRTRGSSRSCTSTGGGESFVRLPLKFSAGRRSLS